MDLFPAASMFCCTELSRITRNPQANKNVRTRIMGVSTTVFIMHWLASAARLTVPGFHTGFLAG